MTAALASIAGVFVSGYLFGAVTGLVRRHLSPGGGRS